MPDGLDWPVLPSSSFSEDSLNADSSILYSYILYSLSVHFVRITQTSVSPEYISLM